MLWVIALVTIAAILFGTFFLAGLTIVWLTGSGTCKDAAQGAAEMTAKLMEPFIDSPMP